MGLGFVHTPKKVEPGGFDIAPLMRRRQIRDSVPRISVADIEDTRLKDSTRMLLVMARLGKPIYEGTANRNAVERRHAKNRVARRARRVHRR